VSPHAKFRHHPNQNGEKVSNDACNDRILVRISNMTSNMLLNSSF